MICPHCNFSVAPTLLETFGFSKLQCDSCGSSITLAWWATLIMLLSVPGTIWFNSLLQQAVPGPFFRGAVSVSMGMCVAAVLHAIFQSIGALSVMPVTSRTRTDNWLGRPTTAIIVLMLAAYGSIQLLPGVET